MDSIHPCPTVLLFGDVTDVWTDGMDDVCRQAATTPWLLSFLRDLFSAFEAEVRTMDRFLQESFGIGSCSSLQELAQRYRRSSDEVGMVHAMLLFTVRAALMLQTATREPHLIINPDDGKSDSQKHLVGISGGLWNAVAVTLASNFATLYEACIEAGRVYARLCSLTVVRSRAMEDRPGIWGWAVVDVSVDELDETLEKSQNAMGIPSTKRVKIAVTGDRWSTIIGPPSVLERLFVECTELRKLSKNELAGIRAMQHTLDVSEADIDYVVGYSPLLSNPLRPGFKLWGMTENKNDATTNAYYPSWGHLLRVAALQTLSQRLDIAQTVCRLSTHIGAWHDVDIRVMGPSNHAAYLANVLKAGAGPTLTRHVTVGDSSAAAAQESYHSQHVREGAVAVVGMSGKGPCSEDLDEFWNVIATGQDCCHEVPSDRFDLEEYYCAKKHGSAHSTGPGRCTTTCRYGCFMKNPGHFDAKFFHISPREALQMDPGHRLFLMTAYEALEMAGYSDGKTRTTDPNKMAVFSAQSADDWYRVTHHSLGCDAYGMQGLQRAFGPGRLAFQMKWEGPTYAVDSACAGATTSIHLACMSLLSRDADMAVAGAANVLSDPHSFTSLSKAGLLSDTGNCKTYRDDADGYSRADFVGAVVLKRLDDAIAHNDKILAVIASTARNHSGNATSITTSDANAQERLFNKVLRSAQLRPDDISYIEMHGTGTEVGDRAEMEAVSKVFSPRLNRKPLPVGAIKANIGHSEAAAGMSSLLKGILMLQKGLLPPQAGMPHSINPSVLKFLKDSSLMIPMELSEFKGVGDDARRILVNNFDAAGGNACLLLEEYKQHPAKQRQKECDNRPTHVIATSARTPFSYVANMKRLTGWLRTHPNTRLQDIAYSTTARRVHHPIRFALSASTPQEAVSKLEAEIGRSVHGISKSGPADVVFVFTGQGSHYAGMGAELYRTSAVFRKTVDLCVAICATNGFPPFMDIITDGAADISTETKNAAQTQLAVVTLEIALTTFWRSIGLEPKTVMGHSLGEYAALYAAGVLSLTDTLYLVGQRARLLLERCERNSYTMLSVSASVDTIRGYLAHIGDSSCAIACINSPNATVLSGTSKDLAQIQENIVSRDANTHTKMLSVPFAYHSCQMDAILNDFKAIASGVTYSPPRIPVASTLFGSLVDKPGIFDEDYLAQQTRHAVDFCGTLSAVKSVFKDPIWLEIGPKPVCTSFIRATLSPSHTKINHTIDANASNWVTISRTLAAAYTSGVDVDWLALHAPYEDDLELLDLPTYAWDMKDYWITHTDKSSALNPTKNQAAVPSELFLTTTAQYLVEKSISPKVKVTFRAGISDHGFVGLIDDHKMQQIGLASEGAFSDAAATVAKYALDYSGRKGVTLAHLTFHDSELLTPLTRDLVGIDGELLTTATMESASAKTILVTFKATSKRGDSYNLGSMRVEYRSPEKAQRNLDRVSFFIKAKMDGLIRLSKEGSGHWIQTDIFYGIIAHVFQISQESRGIKEAFVASDFQEAAGKIVLQPDPKGTRFTSSPYWSGALLHPVGFMLNGNPSKSPQSTFVAMGYDSVEQLANIEPGKEYLTYAHISRWENETAFCNGYVFDPLTSKIVMQAVDLRYQEFKIATWRHILNGPHATGSKHVKSVPQAEKRLQKETRTKILDTQSSAIAAVPIDRIPRKLQDGSESRDSREFAIIIRSLAKATGSDLSEFTDDTLISDVGVDSIMSIEVVAAVKELGVDLPATFLFNYPTIGDLRRAFSRQAASVRDDYYNEQPLGKDNTESLDSREFDVIMSSLAKATGSGLSEFTDDTLITDVGVDSIMSIEVVAAVKELGVDLPATFVFNYPTIGDLRRAFSGSDAILREDDYNEQVLGENESSMCPTPDEVFGATSTPESVSSFSSSPSNFVRIEKNPRVPGLEVKNVASALPPLSARITLLQGRPNTSKTPLYMMADATGTVASYIHLRPFQSKQVVYGVDSPYFRCPSQMISNIDIEHVAKPIVDALIKAQGSGSFLIGGYSAGSLVAFEVSRQLAAAGRSVDGLLLIDMCCPRSLCADRHTLLAEDKFSHDVFEIAANKDSLWSSLSSASRDHFHACFAATNEYTPKPMTPAERPAKTAVIWAERGLVNRVLDDPTIMQNLADRGILTKPYPGFMEDPKLGTFACLIPDKGGMENLGANGWEKFTAGEVLALSVAGDHLELPLPTHVHLLQTQMEKAFTYFSLD